MRICLFSNVFLPSIGGVERASEALADGWVRMGHEVHVVTATPANGFDDSKLPYHVTRSPDDAAWCAILPQSDVLVSNGFSLKYFRAWRRSGVPFGWIHGMLLGGYSSLTWALTLHTRRIATHFGHFNICVSEFMKGHIANRRAHVIPNAISPDFRPLSQMPLSGRLLFFGRMWMPKGMDVLLRAIAEARGRGVELPTDFLGEGPDLEATRKMTGDLNVADIVRFFPFQSGDQLVRTINAAKIVVVPSNWEEPFGLTAAEAMACGRCVVGSRAGGLAEVLGEFAPSFTMGDASGLADLLIDLQTHPSKVAEYERKALLRATEFAQATVCAKYVAFFESVTRRRNPAFA